MTDGDTFTITNNAATPVSVTFESTPPARYTALLARLRSDQSFQAAGGLYGAGHPQCDHWCDQWGAGFGITASGFLDNNFNGRISLLDGKLTDASPWPTVSFGG